MIIVRDFVLPPPDIREVLRYMRAKEASGELLGLINRASDELLPRITPRVCYTELPIAVDGDRVRIGGAECISRGLSTRISGAERAVVFVATVGVEADRLISRYSRISPSLAIAVSALATERVEALCEELCRGVRAEKNALGLDVKCRFSPGYGDLSLDFQREIFKILSPEGKIGVTLTEGLLMTPTKSVSAIVGICDRAE